MTEFDAQTNVKVNNFIPMWKGTSCLDEVYFYLFTGFFAHYIHFGLVIQLKVAFLIDFDYFILPLK